VDERIDRRVGRVVLVERGLGVGRTVNIIEIAVATPPAKAIVASRPVPPSAANRLARRLPSIQRKRRTPKPKTIAPTMIAVSFWLTQATNSAVSLPSGRSSFSSR